LVGLSTADTVSRSHWRENLRKQRDQTLNVDPSLDLCRTS
jgi:hypothetical protein